MNCNYTWYNLPNLIKERLKLDKNIYTCIDQIDEFNNLVDEAQWFDLPNRLKKMCTILELPLVVNWRNILKNVKEICEYIDNLEC